MRTTRPTRTTRTTLFVVLASIAVSACATQPFVWVGEYETTPPAPVPYRIEGGDQLYVSIWNQPQLTGDVAVRDDGNVTLPLVGDIAVVGLTPSDAAETIRKGLDGLVLNPRVSVAVRGGETEHVAVTGEVRTAGQFPLEPGDTVLHLIARAGGLTEFADVDAVYVVRAAPEPVRIRFDYRLLSRGDPESLEFALRDGDVIVVE